MQQTQEKGDALQRIAGVSLILGAILTAVFNILVPRADDPTVSLEVLTAFGEDAGLTRVYLVLLAVGAWLLVGGVAGIYRSLSSGAAAAWARLGFYATVIGAAVFTVLFAQAMALTDAAAEWVAAGSPGEGTTYSIAEAIRISGVSLLSMAIIIEWTALILVGIAVSLSTVYPKWLGWAAVVVGAVTVIVGIVRAIDGPGEALQLIFLITSLLTLIWFLMVGGIIIRREIKLM